MKDDPGPFAKQTPRLDNVQIYVVPLQRKNHYAWLSITFNST